MKNMRNTLFLGSALALAACGGEMTAQDAAQAESLATTKAELRTAPPGKGVEGQYIVVFKDGVDHRAEAARAGVSPMHSYTIIPGFAAKLNDAQLNGLLHNPNVDYIEQDAIVTADTTQSGATWGIDRIDQRSLPLSGTYNYTTTASTVTAYIIDTGIYSSHSQFGGRATNVYDALGGSGTDCHGHGTHVAGTVGSATYGVAKGVKLRGVRVLDCAGSGSNSGVIAGMDYVRLNAVKPAVANMSLGGSFSSSVNTAANNLANSGVFLAVAAGNNASNACNYSPASAASATTVGATTSTDARASYSNTGSCVDIYGPGSSITSTWLNGGTNTISGTSMASPHVAGVAAAYLSTNPTATPATCGLAMEVPLMVLVPPLSHVEVMLEPGP
jgi:subtilisin family serine protease